MRFVKQLDGSAFQSSNCVAATGAMLVDRASGGAIEESGAQVRVQTGDTSGGLGYDQLRWVAGRFWDEVWNFEPSLPWADLVSRARDRGVGLCGSYSVLVGTPHDACRGLFRGNHSVALAEQTADGWIVGDPMADGRYSGCPKGFQEWPDALVRRFAASFVTGISGPVVGAGRAYSIFASADPIVSAPIQTWQAVVHPVPPATRRSFGRYFIDSEGRITHRAIESTGGFSATCTRPIRHRWPARGTTIPLVKITSGAYHGQYINGGYAHLKG